MAMWGAVLSGVGALLVLVDALDRWRHTTVVIDGGDAFTDFDAQERKAKQRALASAAGPMLVLVGSGLIIWASL
jgi:hypothetical protein